MTASSLSIYYPVYYGREVGKQREEKRNLYVVFFFYYFLKTTFFVFLFPFLSFPLSERRSLVFHSVAGWRINFTQAPKQILGLTFAFMSLLSHRRLPLSWDIFLIILIVLAKIHHCAAWIQGWRGRKKNLAAQNNRSDIVQTSHFPDQ